jgi:PPE-repeat protein
MSAVPAMLAMFYGALPPEVNTARLMAGAGVGPMYQAAAGWEALAISLETQADELAGSLAALTGTWQGSASERAVSATQPMVLWLHTTAMQAQKRAMQAIAQASSYATALATTPPIPEIEQNHVTHAVLEATNFLGINTAPIGVNEADYFVRMWNQAAGAMEAYQAETSMNTLFEPIPPMKPIVMPGVAESTAAAVLAETAPGMASAAVRNLIMAQVVGQSTIESAALWTGNAASQFAFAADRAEGQSTKAESAAQKTSGQQDKAQQGTQMMMQVASQVGSQAMQLPQQLGQLVGQPMQQLSQPLQQVTQIFSQMGSSFGNNGAQMGLMGASPFSNHPLAGGSGAASGAGLVRAASMPGMGGTAARTPLMASLVGSPEGASSAAAQAEAGAAAGAANAGKAPVSSAGGAGAGMGPGVKGEKGGGTREALKAPGVLVQDLDDDDDDW